MARIKFFSDVNQQGFVQSIALMNLDYDESGVYVYVEWHPKLEDVVSDWGGEVIYV